MKGNFQIIFIIAFLAAAVLGLMVFAGVIKIGKDKTSSGPKGTVVLWGTASPNDMFKVLQAFNDENNDFNVSYVQKYPETFNDDLVEALASGAGPDLFFLTDDLVWSYRKRIATIPFETYPIANYKKNFVSAGEVFLNSAGIMAFPIAVDPLVMYYNRSMLDAEGVVYPPATWDEFNALVPVFTEKDDTKKISRSAVALGQYTNVAHAKNILAALFMQIGNPIMAEKSGSQYSVLSESQPGSEPAEVLEYYTAFADPLSEVYSWNKSLPLSSDAFSAEQLTFYFGYASELRELQTKNPNQNFLVSPIPQTKGMNFKLTSGRVYGVAVSAFSKNFLTAFAAASKMATGPSAPEFAKALGGVPMRRDLIAQAKPTDEFTPVFYASALFTRSWQDPAPDETEVIFRQMVESVLSNTRDYREALRDAENKINRLLLK